MSAGRRRFRIIKEIAEGGFGKVFLAEQISSDGFSRIVAVKLLHAKWSSHDEVVQRTRDEARLLGLIRHQHIVKVEDLTSIDSKCAIVMEYLEGVDLKWMMQFLKERNEVFPRAALFEIILAAASALDAAYNSSPLQGGEALRVIHRDIKPSNIFVTVAGGVKVLDFGTARANFAEREAKTQALAFGSQGYMAPERMLGEEDTPAADIFSLGITLYELLTLESFGRIPPRPNKFQKKIEERVATVKLEGDQDYTDQVRDTLRVMLSYDPKDRPTAAQLVELMELLAQEAKDTALRRFCRTTVAEAKAALPEAEAPDPLSGAIVDEDASAGTGPQLRSTQYPPDEDASEPASPASPVNSGGGASGPRSRNTGPLPPNTGPGQKGTIAPVESGPTNLPPKPVPAIPRPTSAPPATEGGSSTTSMVVMAGGGLSVAVMIGVGVLAAIGAVLAIVYYLSTQDGTTTPVPDPVPSVAPNPPPDPPPTTPPDPQPALAGGRVTKPDTRTGVKTAKVTLTFSDPAGAEFKIRGPGSFEAEWDGKAPFDMGPLGEGTYKANVKISDAKSFRLKDFQVPANKKACTFTFDGEKGTWSDECK